MEMPQADPPPEIEENPYSQPPRVRENRHPLPPEIQESDIGDIYNAIEYMLDLDDGSDDEDEEDLDGVVTCLDDEDEEDLDRVVTCPYCHTELASMTDFVQDLFPSSNDPVRMLLFNNVINVNFGQVQNQVSTDFHQFELVLSNIYCNSCQNFVGWRIVDRHGDHPVIRAGLSILLIETDVGAVFH